MRMRIVMVGATSVAAAAAATDAIQFPAVVAELIEAKN